jgi:hypothetical protein
MSKLERFNNWCGEIMNKVVRYDDLITFCSISSLLFFAIGMIVVGTLGMLGFIK